MAPRESLSPFTLNLYVLAGISFCHCIKLMFTCAAIQQNPSRSPNYDGQFPIVSPEHVAGAVSPAAGLYFWLNIEVHSWSHLYFSNFSSVNHHIKNLIYCSTQNNLLPNLIFCSTQSNLLNSTNAIQYISNLRISQILC